MEKKIMGIMKCVKGKLTFIPDNPKDYYRMG